jgi:hypothetical protein
MANTLLLDTIAWDLLVDARGNIAMATPPYALAQDAASAIRTYQGEVYYNTTKGVPYDQSILGKTPSIAFMKAQFVKAALTVPGVVSAKCFISSITDRLVTGQVQVRDAAGNTTAANF